MNESKNIAYNAAIKKASQYTYRLIDKEDPSCGGTVISIKIGDRYFFASAAHVISSNHKFQIVHRNTSLTEISEFISCHIDQEADVGLLEIESRYGELFDSWLILSEINKRFDVEKEFPVVVIGYPGEYIMPLGRTSLTDNSSIEFRCCNSLCYASATIPYDQWPNEGLTSSPAKAKDIFIGFELNSEVFSNPPDEAEFSRQETLKCPNLCGMSGGGIWLLKQKDGDIWLPTVELIGIQSSVNKSGWMRGTQISKWLELVVNAYPDLKELLRSFCDGWPV